MVSIINECFRKKKRIENTEKNIIRKEIRYNINKKAKIFGETPFL